uniref:ODAD1 central coiled coil region domain-containing protein n=1 Tax=Toxoplasma gondii TgCATBr9 TaxID=943120 RepID=A0A2T6IVQ6_TOXGO|nr:hypothetical protein TGBR9_202970 [Toxoplasma gondii TgCATBr9]
MTTSRSHSPTATNGGSRPSGQAAGPLVGSGGAHTTYLDEHVARLQAEIERTTRRLEMEKRKLHDLGENSRKAQHEFNDKRLRYSFNKADGIANARKAEKNLTQLENRLAQALVKFNSANDEINKVKATIDKHRKDRLSMEKVYRQVSRELSDQAYQLNEVKEKVAQMQEWEQQTTKRMEELTKVQDQEREEFKEKCLVMQKELREQDRLIKEFDIRAHRESSNLRAQMKGTPYNVAEEEQNFNPESLMKLILKTALLNAVQRHSIKQHRTKIAVFERAMESIKTSTGISDPEEIVAIFSQLEERNYSIMTYVNMLNFELEAIEAKKRELETHIQQQAQHEASALQVTDASLRGEAAQISKMLFATAGKNALVQHQLHCLAQTHEILMEAAALVGHAWKGPLSCDDPPPPGTAEECAAAAGKAGAVDSRGPAPFTPLRDCRSKASDWASSQEFGGSEGSKNILPLLWYLEKFILANQGSLLAAARSATEEAPDNGESPTGLTPFLATAHSSHRAAGGGKGPEATSLSPEPGRLSPRSCSGTQGSGEGNRMGSGARKTMCVTSAASHPHDSGCSAVTASSPSALALSGRFLDSENTGGPSTLSGYGGDSHSGMAGFSDPREDHRTEKGTNDSLCPLVSEDGTRRRGAKLSGPLRGTGDVGSDPGLTGHSLSRAANTGDGLQPGETGKRGRCGESREGALPTHGNGAGGDSEDDDEWGIGTDRPGGDAWIADRPLSIGELRERTIHVLNKQRKKRGDGSGTLCLSEKLCLLATPVLDNAAYKALQPGAVSLQSRASSFSLQSPVLSADGGSSNGGSVGFLQTPDNCARQDGRQDRSNDGEVRDAGMSAAPSTPGGGPRGSRRAPRSGSTYASSQRGLLLRHSRGKEKVFVQLSKKRAGEQATGAADGVASETQEAPQKLGASGATHVRRKTEMPRENGSRVRCFRKRVSGPTLRTMPSNVEERSGEATRMQAREPGTASALQEDTAAARMVNTQGACAGLEDAREDTRKKETQREDKEMEGKENGTRGEGSLSPVEREDEDEQQQRDLDGKSDANASGGGAADHELEGKGDEERDEASLRTIFGCSREEAVMLCVTDGHNNEGNGTLDSRYARESLGDSSKVQDGGIHDVNSEKGYEREERTALEDDAEPSESVSRGQTGRTSEKKRASGESASDEKDNERQTEMPLMPAASGTEEHASSDVSPKELRNAPGRTPEASAEKLPDLFDPTQSLIQECGDSPTDNPYQEADPRDRAPPDDSPHAPEASRLQQLSPTPVEETPTAADLQLLWPSSAHANRGEEIDGNSIGSSQQTPLPPSPRSTPLPEIPFSSDVDEAGEPCVEAGFERSSESHLSETNAVSESVEASVHAYASRDALSPSLLDQTSEESRTNEKCSVPAEATKLPDASARRGESRPMTPTAWHPGVWPPDLVQCGDRSRVSSAGASALNSYGGEDEVAKIHHLSENLALCSSSHGDISDLRAFVPRALEVDIPVTDQEEVNKVGTSANRQRDGDRREKSPQKPSDVKNETEAAYTTRAVEEEPGRRLEESPKRYDIEIPVAGFPRASERFQSEVLERPMPPLRPPFSAGSRGPFESPSFPTASRLDVQRPSSSPSPGFAPARRPPNMGFLPLPPRAIRTPNPRPLNLPQRLQKARDTGREGYPQANQSEATLLSLEETKIDTLAARVPDETVAPLAAFSLTLSHSRETSEAEVDRKREVDIPPGSRAESRNSEGGSVAVRISEGDATEQGIDPEAGSPFSCAEGQGSVAHPASVRLSPFPLSHGDAAEETAKHPVFHEETPSETRSPEPCGCGSVDTREEKEKRILKETDEWTTGNADEGSRSLASRSRDEQGSESTQSRGRIRRGNEDPLTLHGEREAAEKETRVQRARATPDSSPCTSPTPSSPAADQHDLSLNTLESSIPGAGSPETCLGGQWSSDSTGPKTPSVPGPAEISDSTSVLGHLSQPFAEPSRSATWDNQFSRGTRKLQMQGGCFPPPTEHIRLLHLPLCSRHDSGRDSPGKGGHNRADIENECDEGSVGGNRASECARQKTHQARGSDSEQNSAGAPQKEGLSSFFHFPNDLPVPHYHTPPGTPPNRSRPTSALGERDREPGHEETVVAETVFDGRRITAKVSRVHVQRTHSDDESAAGVTDGKAEVREEITPQEGFDEENDETQERHVEAATEEVGPVTEEELLKAATSI